MNLLTELFVMALQVVSDRDSLLAIILAIGFIPVLLAGWHRFRRHKRDENIPADMRGAKLVMSEKDILTDFPVRLAGRPDEVYLHRAGYLVPVDTKTRQQAKVFLDDVIQLSVYGVLLRHSPHRRLPGSPRRPVADYGYVRIVTGKSIVWLKVSLWPESKVAQAYERRIALEEGRVKPSYARHPATCRRCGHRTSCGKG